MHTHTQKKDFEQFDSESSQITSTQSFLQKNLRVGRTLCHCPHQCSQVIAGRRYWMQWCAGSYPEQCRENIWASVGTGTTSGIATTVEVMKSWSRLPSRINSTAMLFWIVLSKESMPALIHPFLPCAHKNILCEKQAKTNPTSFLWWPWSIYLLVSDFKRNDSKLHLGKVHASVKLNILWCAANVKAGAVFWDIYGIMQVSAGQSISLVIYALDWLAPQDMASRRILITYLHLQEVKLNNHNVPSWV